MPTRITEALGVFQSDVIIRTALEQAIADMRANPWLLDYVFSSLRDDTLTSSAYGEKEIAQAKKWFLKTEIPVMLSARVPDGARYPVVVTLDLLSSTEEENSLADIHYHPQEDVEVEWHALTSRFDPVRYDVLTGRMEVSSTVGDELVIARGMVVVDRVGKTHEITEVESRTVFYIAKNTVADFHGSFIKPARPSYVAGLEGAAFKESYAIGCHVLSGEAVHLFYLHSIVVFALLRYRQSLLEDRGFERSFIASTAFDYEPGLTPEVGFWRTINMIGHVRQVWPKTLSPKLTNLDVSAAAQKEFGAEAVTEFDEEWAWLADQDQFGNKIE